MEAVKLSLKLQQKHEEKKQVNLVKALFFLPTKNMAKTDPRKEVHPHRSSQKSQRERRCLVFSCGSCHLMGFC